MKKKIWLFHKSYQGAKHTYDTMDAKKGDLIPDMVKVFNTEGEAMEYARSFNCEWNGNGWSSPDYQYVSSREIDIADGVPSEMYGTHK